MHLQLIDQSPGEGEGGGGGGEERYCQPETLKIYTRYFRPERLKIMQAMFFFFLAKMAKKTHTFIIGEYPPPHPQSKIWSQFTVQYLASTQPNMEC